jgi:hypothetical protein
MAVTAQQGAQCVVWYGTFSSVTKTQRDFRRQYNCHHVPSHRDIVKWYNMFLENGLTMPHTGGSTRDRYREEDIRRAMIQSPRKSLRRLSAEKNVPCATRQDCPTVPQHVSIPHNQVDSFLHVLVFFLYHLMYITFRLKGKARKFT